MKPPRLGVRSRLLAAIVVAVAVALAIGVATFNVLLGQRLSASATSSAKAQADAALSSVRIVSGRLIAPEQPDEGTVPSQFWVFSDGQELERPSAATETEAGARSLAGGPERSLDISESARLYAVPVVQGGRRLGTVVAAISLDPYEETERTALIGSLILAAVLLLAVTLISRWMLGRALLPVSRMTESAATWSEHDLDRRFDLGDPYDELTKLAATLDRLLERIAASLRREQRFTAELSHELRTPLTRIGSEAELMLRRDRTTDEYRAALEAIKRNADQMTRAVEALVAAARQEAGLVRSTSDARDAVRTATASVHERGHRDLRVTLPPEPVRVAVDEELLERMLGPLIDNAVRYGRTTVDVSLVRNGRDAFVYVVDDGPGVSEEETAIIFEPGTRGSAAEDPEDGAGLGLALAQRIARSAGGEIFVTPSTAAGQFALRLPLAG